MIQLYNGLLTPKCLLSIGFWMALFVFVPSNNTQAQISSYNFSQNTGTYTPLNASATTLFTAIDDQVINTVTIPFSFNYLATNYTNCKVSTNGFLTLNPPAGGTNISATVYTPISSTNANYATAISGLGRDLNATVKYQTLGTTPNRVFVVEWSNAYRIAVGNTENINFQIKLYETTNVVEIQYGAITTPNSTLTTGTVEVGLKGSTSSYNNVTFTNANLTGYTYTNSWNSLVNGSLQGDVVGITSTIYPASGTLLRWVPSACSQVAVVASAATITANSAVLNWTANAIYTSGYRVRWRKVDEPYTASSWATPVTLAAGTNTYTITGLASSTYYVYSIEGVCSASSANNFSTVTTANTANGKGLFKTTCPTYNLNFLQGFNATTIPNCWTQTFVSGSSNLQYVTSSTGPTTAPQEGSHYVFWNSLSFTSGQTTRLVTPAINTVGSPNVNVKFYWFHDNSAYTGAAYADEGVKLQYSLNGTTWTDVQAVNRVLTGVNGWTQYDIALPAAAGNGATVYVGFLFTSRFGNNCAMDDVQIYVPPPCTTPTAQPTTLVLNSITSTSLNGAFTAAAPAPSSYIVLRSTSNIAPSLTNGTTYTNGTSYTLSGNSYMVVANGTATSFTSTGLSPNTQYYYYVYAYNGSCAGAPYYLNTAPLTSNALTCTAATSSLTGVAASTTSATITFGSITGASSYILSYSVAGANGWVVASPAPTASPYTLTGLTAGTAYDIRIQGPNSSCGTLLTTSNAFTTPCATIPLTVTQGFEAGTTLPACWTQQYVSGTKAFSFGSTATAAGTSPNPAAATGNNRLLFPSYSNSGNQTRFYSPPITTVGTTSVDVEYKWYYSTTGGSGSYLTEGVQLQYSTNGTTWTNVGALTRRYGATDGWQTLTFTLPLAAGNQATLYVGFLFTANAGYDSYMDDIVVRPTPTCLPPSTLSITGITGTGATLNWAAATPAPSAGYQWEIRTAGAGGSGASGLATSGSTAAGVLTAASGTLTPTTTYTLYVRSNCGSGDYSTWASSATFTTPCATFNVPYTQNFESTTTPNIPNCMSAINSNADGYAWSTCTSTSLGNATAIAPVSGVNQIGIRYNSSAAMDDWFFLPAINLNAGVTYLLTYYVRPYSTTGYEEKLEVKYGPIASAAGMTSGTLVSTETLIGGVAYTQKAAYFTPTSTGVYYVGFHGQSITNQYYLFIDDISLTVAPACTSVSGGAAIAARTNFCAGSGSTTLTATGYTTMGTGLTYQWQSSTNNFSTVVNDLPGATNPSSANTGIITASTSFRLKVTCTNSGLVAYSNTVLVTVGTMAITGTTPATRCGIGTATLLASATSGSTTSWYSTAVGGVSLATGSSFTTPTISGTTTYYVAANDGSIPATVGATYSGAADNGTNTGGHGIVFTTTGNDITILSAKIPFSGKGTFTIQLQNNSGAVLQTIVTDTLSGGGTTPITVPLNILVSTPGTYRLILNSITGTIDALGYLSSATYPFTGLGGLFSVTSGYWYGNDVDNMYFFDLMVTNMCESARYPVVVTVTPPPALTLSSGDTTICSGSGVVMNVTNPVANFNSYVWSPSTGVTHGGSPLGASSTLAPTTTTNYTLTATSASGCVNQKTALFMVNPAPPVTTSAAVCSGTAATLTASSSCNGYGAPTNTIAGSWTAGVDPVALRPIIFIANSPTCLFDNTVTRNYVTHTFQVTVSGSYTFDMTPNTNYDGMGYIVFGPFVPGNCAGGGTWVVGDDDSGPSSLEPLMTANLTVGTQYTLVTTTYSASSGTVTDNFIWNITGPVGGQITTVSTGTLQWFTTATGGTSIGSGTPFNPVGVSGSGIASSSSVGSYTFYAACTNNLTCRTATTYVIGSAGQWIGGTDANWSNPANWCGGVPTISTNATIASGAPFKPVLSTGTGTVQNLTVQPGATLTVSNALMQISGTITATGSIVANNGTIELKGAAIQTISGSSFTGRTIRNLILSNQVNVSNVTGDTLRITGDLSFGNVNNKALNSGNNITLGSSSTRTARVTDLTNGGQNTGNSITGNFVVERYIPARRAWRLMTAPIAIGAQTINQAWQENTGGNWALDPHPGYGTHISGGPARSTAQGFDQGPNTSSIFAYGLSGWNQIPTNLLTEKVTSNQGYMLFIRGSRIINLPLSTPVTVPDSTVLRPTGGIRTGSQPAVTNASGGFTVVGNPYPSPINFNNLTRSGVIGGNNTYYAWDPTLAGSLGVGAYVTLSWNGTDYDKSVITSIIDTTGIIPSGAAIMANFSPGGSIAFEEADKCAEAPGPVYHFRPNGSRLQLRASLLTVQGDGIRAMNDGALITFNDVNNNNVTDEDAVKINNFFENWAIKNQGQVLSIERRNSLASADTIFFDMWNMRQRQYELWFDAQLGNMLQGYTAYLEDTYLQTKTPLQLDQRTSYGFTVTAIAGSAARNRFRLIFAPANVLPVTITQIEAFQQNKDIVVKWQVQQELDMLSYQLQTSLDGIHFENCYLTNARGSGSIYQWLHVQPATGNHYYRVKCIDADGTYRYSQIVMVKLSKDATPVFSIAPNPVQGQTLQLWYRQIRGGKFVGNIYNEGGQLIQTHAQLLANGNGNWTIKLPEGLAAGVYQLILQNEQMEKYVLPFRLK